MNFLESRNRRSLTVPGFDRPIHVYSPFLGLLGRLFSIASIFEHPKTGRSQNINDQRRKVLPSSGKVRILKYSPESGRGLDSDDCTKWRSLKGLVNPQRPNSLFRRRGTRCSTAIKRATLKMKADTGNETVPLGRFLTRVSNHRKESRMAGQGSATTAIHARNSRRSHKTDAD
jgi:hypothetical protein